jgi:hypothetical protein
MTEADSGRAGRPPLPLPVPLAGELERSVDPRGDGPRPGPLCTPFCVCHGGDIVLTSEVRLLVGG